MLKMSKILIGGVAVAAMSLSTSGVFAADKIELIHSDTVAQNNIRSVTLRKEFGECLGDEFSFKDYHGATLFKQGTELTAMQRGNLDTGTLAVFDFYNQVPEMSILGTGYLYRSYEHMRAVWDSGVLKDLMESVEKKAKVKILSNPYIGKRHVNIKGNKKIMTPADLAGVKLRMPGGEGWQFLGKALGANPTPLAFTEVYTALQTGAVDGQDNALPADKSMKFYEVTDQIILTGHFIANNQFSISMSKWNILNDKQKVRVQSCATNFQKKLDSIMLKQEAELVDFFRSEGLKVYEPNIEAFRNHALDVYRNSKFSKDWPKGMVEKINAL